MVQDEQHAAVPGALVRLTSSDLIGGVATASTDERGQLRFRGLPPGSYALDVELDGFTPFHEEDLRIGGGATLERTVVLKIAGLADSFVVEGSGSRIEAREGVRRLVFDERHRLPACLAHQTGVFRWRRIAHLGDYGQLRAAWLAPALGIGKGVAMCELLGQQRRRRLPR